MNNKTVLTKTFAVPIMFVLEVAASDLARDTIFPCGVLAIRVGVFQDLFWQFFANSITRYFPITTVLLSTELQSVNFFGSVLWNIQK